MDIRFVSDLTKYEFSEQDRSGWVHAFNYGTYKHPVYGTIQIDDAKARRFSDNVNNRVRGIDLAIDYEHKKDQGAAGWVKKSDIRNDGLWLFVEWTEHGYKDIKSKKYRFFSPEFKDTWEDASGKLHKDVLFGGGITNRPFLKDLNPLNLSEIEDSMPLEKIKETLGLTSDASEEEVQKAVKGLINSQKPADDVKPANGNTDGADDGNGANAGSDTGVAGAGTVATNVGDNAQLSEVSTQLSEALRKIATLEESHRLSEVNASVTSLSQGDKYSLTPVAQESLRKSMLLSEDNTALSEFVKLVTEGKAIVELNEKGSASFNEPTGSNDPLHDAVTKLSESEGISYEAALDKVASTNPKLLEGIK